MLIKSIFETFSKKKKVHFWANMLIMHIKLMSIKYYYLGCVFFDFKLILEMFFRKTDCLVGPENWVKRKITSFDRKICPIIL